MKAVVYDKWLHTLGGAEVVAVIIAQILKDLHYQVTFISGREVSKEIIKEKFNIDLNGINFLQVWNDELALKQAVKDQDLFINISFMDYSRGFAKRNLYYANFPTKTYSGINGMIFNYLILPIAAKLLMPIEAVSAIDAQIIINEEPVYLLKEENKYAFSNLKENSIQIIEFTLHLQNFSKILIENIKIELENGFILDQFIKVDHEKNLLHYYLKFKPETNTVYLNLKINNQTEGLTNLEKGEVYLLYPKIRLRKLSAFFLNNIFDRLIVRLRAGVFVNILGRLKTYQLILTYSEFAQGWIKNYWKRDAVVLSPPVPLLSNQYKKMKYKKRNWICSVGRFFTLGHGKKQEVLVDAFKKLYDQGKNDWELHLVGGLGDEPSSLEFFKYLKENAKDYPIFFHINASRNEVEEVYLKSKIYWHATGFGEDENYQPIKFEHFGIAPVEALSAGCIPILFDGGGLREIAKTTGLSPDRNLFHSIDQLLENTIFFQNEKNQKFDWDLIFKEIDLNYSVEAFKKRFTKLITK